MHMSIVILFLTKLLGLIVPIVECAVDMWTPSREVTNVVDCPQVFHKMVPSLERPPALVLPAKSTFMLALGGGMKADVPTARIAPRKSFQALPAFERFVTPTFGVCLQLKHFTENKTAVQAFVAQRIAGGSISPRALVVVQKSRVCSS
jgi:hypothetical protein